MPSEVSYIKSTVIRGVITLPKECDLRDGEGTAPVPSITMEQSIMGLIILGRLMPNPAP
jgi:hypothetical protein